MIYFDQAATTKPYPEVIEAVSNCLAENWGNPSSQHGIGNDAKRLLEDARKTIARTIHAKPEEIFFTSGSTEPLNWFIRNLDDYETYTTLMEHPSVLNSMKNRKIIELNKQGIPISKDIPELGIAVMAYVNNEIGTIIPLKGIIDRHTILFLDATQAYGHIPINVKTENISFLVASAHKIHGPKGVGFVYIEKDLFDDVCSYFPIQYGGGQEFGFRSGTENVPGIVGMAKAAEITCANRRDKNRKIAEIRNYLYGEITNNIKCAHLNGTTNWQKRWCGNLNFRFDGYKGEELLAWFDANNIAVSTGSACSSHSNEPSHVLKAIGLSDEQANSSIRFTFDETNNIKEAKEVYRVLVEGLNALKR